MISPDARVVDIERVGAADERRLVDVLRRLDPSWGSMTFDIADGVAVLAGSGLFVNRCLGAGLIAPVSPDDLEHLEQHAAEVGVAAAFEVSEATRADVLATLARRDYSPGSPRTVVFHELDGIDPPDGTISVSVIGADEVSAWQTVSAAGWGHVDAVARAANDAYAFAALRADNPGLLLARAKSDGRVLGVAALRMTDGIATLGGMSTLPAERRQGVQRALVASRLQIARDHGCRLATSMTEARSASLRNLERAGFRSSHTRTTWTRPEAAHR